MRKRIVIALLVIVAAGVLAETIAGDLRAIARGLPIPTAEFMGFEGEGPNNVIVVSTEEEMSKWEELIRKADVPAKR